MKWLLACLFSLSFISSYSYAEQEYPPDIQKINAKKELVVAIYNIDAPPFFYHDDKGTLQGSDILLAKNIAKDLGVSIRFYPLSSFEDIIQAVNEGKADIAISHISKTIQRGTKVLFTHPYMLVHQSLVTQRLFYQRFLTDNKDWISVLNNPEKKIGFMKTSSYKDFAEHLFPQAHHIDYPNVPNALEALRKGSIDACFADETFLNLSPEDPILIKIPLHKDWIAIATSWKNLYLYFWLNNYLEVTGCAINPWKE